MAYVWHSFNERYDFAEFVANNRGAIDYDQMGTAWIAERGDFVDDPPNRNQAAAAKRDLTRLRKRVKNDAPAAPKSRKRTVKPQLVSQISDRKTSTESVSDPFKTYVFRGKDETSQMIPVFTGEEHIHGDCIIVGDVHLPTTDYELSDLMLTVARKTGIRQLVICGDLLNFDAYSKYESIIPPLSFQTEIEAALTTVGRWAGWFDDMLMGLGNHERRLLKYNRGAMRADALGKIIAVASERLRISTYSHVIIHSGGQIWRATHQRNYSQIPLRVGRELALKTQMNIITQHQHHVAKGRDKFNRYTVIDGGGLFDEEKMAYVMLEDSTSPTMCRGFVVLVNGVAHLITPYRSFTDLSVLLAGLSVQRALAA